MKKVDYAALLWLGPMMLACYFGYVWQDFQLDDALIYLRYIKNFQEGYGLVYNPGERFNGLTSPFFTFLMLLGSFWVNNLQWLTVVCSVCFLVITGYLAAKLLTRSRFGQLLTILSIVGFGYFYSTIGMETPLFLLLIVLSLYLYKINSDYVVISLALLVITRSEGIFLAIPIGIDYLIRHQRLPKFSLLIIGLGLFAAPWILNKWYYGDFLAVTGSAKIGQGKSGFWGYGWIFFQAEHLFGFFSGKRFIASALVGFAALGALVQYKNRLAWIALIFNGLLLGFYGFLNIPSYHWYYAPFFLFILIFACVAIEWLMLKIWRSHWIALRGFSVLALVLLLGFYFKYTMPWERGFTHQAYIQIGQWLNANTPKNASVALVEVGTVGWYADRHIIDILGLTNPYNAGYIAKGDADSWPIHYQPDYILIHQPLWIHETVVKYLEEVGAYAPVAQFEFPGYALLQKTQKYSDSEIAKMPAAFKASQKK